MTTLTERPVDARQFEQVRGQVRALTITVIVLAVTLVGLGAWAIYAFTTASETAITTDVEGLVDDYITAWNEYDGDAFMVWSPTTTPSQP